VDEPRVDAPRRLGRALWIEREEVAPVDGTRGRYRTAAGAIGKDAPAHVVVELVDGANLAVTVAIGGVGKLHGNGRAPHGPVEARTRGQYVVDKLLSHGQWQELMDRNPLIVPAHQAARLLEHRGRWHATPTQPIHGRVVKPQE